MEDIIEFDCPYCGEANSLTLDRSGGDDQRLISDCEVCCKPMHIHAVFAIAELGDADDEFDDDFATEDPDDLNVEIKEDDLHGDENDDDVTTDEDDATEDEDLAFADRSDGDFDGSDDLEAGVWQLDVRRDSEN